MLHSRAWSIVFPSRTAVLLGAALLLFIAACGADQEDQDQVDQTRDITQDTGADGGLDGEIGPDLRDMGLDDSEEVEADVVDELFVIDPERILDDVTTLASDEWGGREPGTPGNHAAVDFVESLFEERGLIPVGDGADSYRQRFDYTQWHLGELADISIEGQPLVIGTDYFVPDWSGSGNVHGELVFVGYGITIPPYDIDDFPDCPIAADTGYDDYAEIDVTDRIALVMRHGPDDRQAITDNCPANDACLESPCLWNYGYKAENARLHGAAAMVLVQDYAHDPEIPAGGLLGEEYFIETFPVIFALRTIIEAELPDLATWAEAIDTTLTPASNVSDVGVSIELEIDLVVTTAENLLGVIEGTDPALSGEIIVIGAHLDHMGTDPVTGEIFNGADDNASGTAVMMELVRAMTLSGIEPARTVLFAGWNAEEEGLIGSCHYVENPVYSMEETFAVFSVDMVGGGTGTGMVLYGALEPEFEWIAEVMDGAQEEAGLSLQVIPMIPLPASDHACFAERGVPAVLAESWGPHPNYHTPADTAANIRVDDLETSAQLMWTLLLTLSLGTEGDYLDEE